MMTEPGSRPKAAIFVDVENQTDLRISELMDRLRGYDIVERQAYADWRNWCLDGLAEGLERADFQLYYARSGRYIGARKNTADGYMVRGMLDAFAKRPEITIFVIVSGDGYFSHITRDLRQRGKAVIVAANPDRVNRLLRGLANCYLPLGEAGSSVPDDYLPRAPSGCKEGTHERYV